jgi:quercetin dioxygenase-like cupin family protein
MVDPNEGTYLPNLDLGVMIPPHTHSPEHERNYVSKGELTCDVGGEIAVAQAGSSVVKHR